LGPLAIESPCISQYSNTEHTHTHTHTHTQNGRNVSNKENIYLIIFNM